MDEQTPETDEERRRRRRRDVLTLDLPLVLVLALCLTLTVIEVNRAGAGNWRALVYSFEWPLIGAFSVWIWFRFRKEGGSFRGFTTRWRERVERFEAEADAADAARGDSVATPPDAAAPPAPSDPGLDAWQAYRAGLREREQADGRG